MENLTEGYESTYDTRINSNQQNHAICYRYNCPHNRYLYENAKLDIKKAAAPTKPKLAAFLIIQLVTMNQGQPFAQ